MDCGFTDSASFARSFKEHFNMSASLWRQTKSHDQSNISKIKSKNCQLLGNQRKEISESSTYIDYRNNSQLWTINMGHKSQTVEVKDLAEMTVAYVSHIGPYEGNARLFERLYNKLFKVCITVPESGYVLDAKPAFELYLHTLYPYEENKNRSKDKVVVDICVPVKPL